MHSPRTQRRTAAAFAITGALALAVTLIQQRRSGQRSVGLPA